MKESHIIPAFVFRWLRDTSATGHIRSAETPNKRVQDGLKVPLLCEECEQRLNVWEKPFSERVFHPWYEQSGQSIKYGDWLLKFCVSLSWRVLRHIRDFNGLAHLSDPQKMLSETALKRWTDFMLGRVPHPGPFEQHLIPLGAIDSHTFGEMPQNINRYMLRAVELDLAHSSSVVFTYSKIGPFGLFGIIQPTTMKWEGSKVHVKYGVLGPGKYLLPTELFEYIKDRARNYGNIQAGMSERQFDKIDATSMGDIDRFRASGTFAAMHHDVRLFGDASVLRQSKRKHTD
ncbi:hypothetical protein CU048_07745 [Beijerinckiaceae bacterium]|nr:hypothetical protein CU048_07745 [Beijerinckiaceae bacterium]